MSETQGTNEENKITDPMLLAYFDGSEPKQEPSEEQLEQERLKQQEEESNRVKEEEEQRNQEAEAQRQREEEERAAEEEKQKALAQAEKPKKWDEGLSDQAKFVLEKLSKGEDREVFELLKNKFGYENLSEEQKALTFLAEKHPELDHDDLVFLAQQEYGIGAEAYTKAELDLMSDEQKSTLRKQEIDRKKLLSTADKFFAEKATNIEIPALPNPLDEDEGYKEYQSFKSQQEELRLKQEEQAKIDEEYDRKIEEEVKSTALEIEVLPIDLKIDLDQGEFALKSEFKLDDAKKKQLADYALEYTPTQGEIKAHQDQSGKLDMKGYMTMLAKRLFSDQINKAALKQALSKDREEFTERELKNSSLRNNDNMQFADREEAFEVSAMRQ